MYMIDDTIAIILLCFSSGGRVDVVLGSTELRIFFLSLIIIIYYHVQFQFIFCRILSAGSLFWRAFPSKSCFSVVAGIFEEK